MNDTRIKVRANRSTGELEVEGPAKAVAEWWERLWPELGNGARFGGTSGILAQRGATPPSPNNSQLPDVFGEFYSEFRSDIADVDKVLIAGAFVQGKDVDRVFSTKGANQLLLDQNIKVANASESVRRLTQAKRVFVVSDGKFRVSASGLEHLQTLRVNP
jgi:hypothetical protein